MPAWAASRRLLPGLIGQNYAAATKALIARMALPPSPTRARIINNLIISLQATGVWSKLDALYLFAAADSQAALLNWKSTSFNCTAVNSPTFTADRGYAGDGVSSYLNTAFTPSTAAGNFVQDSAMLGVWINAGTDTADGTGTAMGAAGGNGSFIVPRFTGDLIRGRINQAATANCGASTTRRGLTCLDRSGAALTTGYRNGASAGTMTTASSGLATVAVFLGANDTTGSPTGPVDNRMAAAAIGGSLGDAGNLALYNALNTYLTAVGAA